MIQFHVSHLQIMVLPNTIVFDSCKTVIDIDSYDVKRRP